jgi:hypothetical protein
MQSLHICSAKVPRSGTRNEEERQGGERWGREGEGPGVCKAKTDAQLCLSLGLVVYALPAALGIPDRDFCPLSFAAQGRGPGAASDCVLEQRKA